MKTLRLILFVAVTCMLTACGNSMKPMSAKIEGDLMDYFEVVFKDYKTTDGKVAIEFKRIKEGFPEPWRKDLEIGTEENTIMPTFIAEFQDKDGNVISVEKSSISEKKELQNLASTNVNETSIITFTCPEEAVKFKISSTYKYNVLINLEGAVGTYPIAMTLHVVTDGDVTGAYYYKRKGPGNYLYLKAENASNDMMHGESIMLNEYSKNGVKTSAIQGSYENGIFNGALYNFSVSCSDYLFKLHPANNMKEIDLNGIDFDLFY